MPFSLSFTEEFKHDLARLDNSIKQRLPKIFDKIKENPSHYIAMLTNFIDDLRVTKKYRKCLAVINKLKTISTGSESVQARIFINSFIHETLLYSATGEFEKGIPQIKIAESALDKYKDKINKPAELNIY